MNKIKTLAKFLLDINSSFRPCTRHTKEKPSFISNKISECQQHSDKIKELASQCGWTLTEFLPKWNEKKQRMSEHSFWIGIMNGNECETVDDFLS
jgi:hypothetical protein